MSTELIRTDVVVVGAGLAGLAAARLLQRAGLEVVVVDPSAPGGRGRSDIRGEVIFNRGPHALYLGGPAERVLTGLGVPIDGGYAGGARSGALYRGKVSLLPSSAGTLARTDLLTARGKLAAARFLSRLPKVRTDALGVTTFAAWLDEQDLPADTRATVEMLARVATYVNAPDIAAADMIVGQMQAALGTGVRYVHGGWQSLVDSLVASLTVIRHGATAVARDAADVVVTLDDDSRVVARAAVLAAGTPDAAAALLGRPAFTIGPPVMAACLDLATSAPATPSLLFGVDVPLYLSNHCPPARLAPDGVHVVHVAHYLAPEEVIDPVAGRAELMEHAARAGITEDVIVDARYLHRMTVVGGLATAAHGGLAGRPAVDASGVPGVFLAGDWVGPTGHLLDASMASAEDAARRAHAAASNVTLVG